MQSADLAHLARSKSTGFDKKPPPPIRPKPSALAAPAVDAAAPGGSTSTATLALTALPQRTSITVTDDGAPASTSFGDLRKAFEQHQNSSPLFMGGIGGPAAASPSSKPAAEGLSSGHASHGSISRLQGSSSMLSVPSIGSRPRSVSSPAPPLRENAESIAAPDGIDNTQPNFGNLRARFQSQANLSSAPPPKPEALKSRPKPAINAPKPAMPTATSSMLRPGRMSLDSFTVSAPATRFSSPQPPAPLFSGSSTPGVSISPPPPPPRLSLSSSLKQPQPPRPPPVAKFNVTTKAPTPPRTPTQLDTLESERNPFVGSDEDEPSPTKSSSARSSLHMRTSSKILQNPVFQQLSHDPKPLLASVPGRDSVLVGKVAPPAPQRAAPRPDSPHDSTTPPKLPSRSNSAILSAEDTPEEKERKHRLDKRYRVIQELLETEISYSKDMQLLQEVYVNDMVESHQFTQADEKIVFMNLSEVIALTVDFIALLAPACGGEPNESYNDAKTFVGEAFLQMMSRIRRVYSEYCKRQEASAQHLQELESRRDLRPFFEACHEKCKGKTTTWDLASFLIKPVQRVLKYPLLINQIYALTPPGHTDYDSLAEVQKDMVQVAEEINEIKKRKDIVEKIVGPKKKTDSDIILTVSRFRHGFNKKFSRTTQQLRQAVGGSDVTVDILFEALLEKFNLQQHLAREFARYILNWLVSIKQFFDTQEAFALTLREIYAMVPIHKQDENNSIILVNEFHKSLSQFSKTIGRELESRLKQTVYKSIERFLKLFSGPLQVMKKREKKLLDYDSVRGMKERGDTVDKNMLESAEAYTAINEQLLDELPAFLGLTTQYFDLIVMEFSKVQMFFYAHVKAKIVEFYVQNIDPNASSDVDGYLATMNVCEDYIAAMRRDDGPLARLQQVSLIKGVAATHETAFQNMREVSQRRRRTHSLNLPPRSRSSSNASRSPMQTPGSDRYSWQSKMASSHQGAMVESPTASEFLQPPLQPRYYPGEDENPFEMPESIFHEGSVVSEEYEPFGRNGSISSGSSRNIFESGRPLSTASSAYSFQSGGNGSGSGFGGHGHGHGHGASEYDEFANSKPPALDDGMDADEIGIAQALFECTAIYPYSSTEERQLSFEAGESIVVFGLNEDGWYFGKKVGKDTTGWFPASHCIQI
ncbi:hypothetical protein BGZ98_008339 [Dissophora globulifera]|nr:hypothetical protein BGZ98_008339 [Dissophora globulifera]